MKRFCGQIIPGSLVCLALSLPIRAADNAPTVDSVLDKFVEASGGRAAIQKVTSRAIKGEMDMFGSTSDWTAFSKPPNKQVSEFSNGTLGTIADGFDGTVAWSKNQQGVRVKEGEELAKTRRDADFYRYLDFKKLYPDLAYKGIEKVDGEETHVLESRPSESSKERFSFNVKSGLLVRQESEFESPQGRLNLSIHLGDYRAVDGVKYPHSVKFNLGVAGQQLDFAIRIKEVKHNVPIEDAKFAKPAE